jgi:hypothetical protein
VLFAVMAIIQVGVLQVTVRYFLLVSLVLVLGVVVYVLHRRTK